MSENKMNSESNPGDKMKAQADRQTENTVEQGELDTKDDINTCTQSKQSSPVSRHKSDNMFSSLVTKLMNKSKSRATISKKMSIKKSNLSIIKSKNIDNIIGITDVTVLEEKLGEVKIRLTDEKPLKWAIYDFNCLIHMKSREYEDVTSLK